MLEHSLVSWRIWRHGYMAARTQLAGLSRSVQTHQVLLQCSLFPAQLNQIEASPQESMSEHQSSDW